jgi:hypothetical protein
VAGINSSAAAKRVCSNLLAKTRLPTRIHSTAARPPSKQLKCRTSSVLCSMPEHLRLCDCGRMLLSQTQCSSSRAQTSSGCMGGDRRKQSPIQPRTPLAATV